MMPHIGQHYVVHHWKVGVNKAEEVVKNYHVQREVLPELILGRSLVSNNIGHYAEDKVDLAHSLL